MVGLGLYKIRRNFHLEVIDKSKYDNQLSWCAVQHGIGLNYVMPVPYLAK